MDAGEAVKEAEEKGKDVYTTTDAKGNEFKQRPFDINAKPKGRPGRKPKGTRVEVFNKVNTRVYTSDGRLEPLSRGSILLSDFKAMEERGLVVAVVNIKA